MAVSALSFNERYEQIERRNLCRIVCIYVGRSISDGLQIWASDVAARSPLVSLSLLVILPCWWCLCPCGGSGPPVES